MAEKLLFIDLLEEIFVLEVFLIYYERILEFCSDVQKALHI